MKIKSIGPITEAQWPKVAKRLFAMGKTWHDGDSFLQYNPFESISSIKNKKICIHQNNRGFFFKENEGAELSVDEFLNIMPAKQEFKKPRHRPWTSPGSSLNVQRPVCQALEAGSVINHSIINYLAELSVLKPGSFF